MNEHREEHLDLCAAYALGNLDPADRQRLESHLDRGCPICDAALADFAEGTIVLAASAPAAQPSPELRSRVLSLVAAETRANPETRATREPESPRARVLELKRRPAFAWGMPVLATVAAALAVASVLFFREARRLRGELENSKREVGMIARRLSEEERLNEVLSAPGAKVAVLEMTPSGEEAMRARATYDPASRRAVLVFENLRAPAGRDYELWAIRDGAPASLGVIRPDANGNAVIQVADAGEAASLAAFAVSLEPAGGSPNPTAPSGPVVMLGKLGG